MDKEKRNIQTLATTQSKYLSDILEVCQRTKHTL